MIGSHATTNHRDKHRRRSGIITGRKGETMAYELVIVWETGEKDIFEYNSREDAEKSGNGFKVALGEQVAWYGVRRKV